VTGSEDADGERQRASIKASVRGLIAP